MKILQKLIATSLIALLSVTSIAQAAETVTYFHNDLLGSPAAATDESGEVIWRENYQAFGEKVKNQDEKTGNVIGYTGHVHDEDTGLTYMQARYYDPLIGRFYANDPVGFVQSNPVSFNRYAYANNNPYKFVDPDGNSPTIPIGAGVGALEDMAFQGVMILAGAQEEYSWKSTAVSAGLGAATSGYSAVAHGGRLGIAFGKLARKIFGKSDDVAKNVGNLTKSQQRAIRGLEDQISAHQKKLADYKANPDAFDNKGFLKNASPELREKIISSRINSLEKQINTFKKDIDAIQSGAKEVLEKL